MSQSTPLIRHFLATLAYRTRGALRGAPASFASFDAGHGVRTPQQLLRHVNGLLEVASGALRTGDKSYRGAPQNLTWEGETARFYALLTELDAELASRTPEAKMLENLLQGPLTDALTHTGQLTLLRRLAGTPVAGENFRKADIRAGRTGPEASPETEL